MAKKLQLENNPLFNMGSMEEKTTEEPTRRGRPRDPEVIREEGVKKGLRPGQTRVTFIMQEDALKFVKDYAHTERITIREALDEIIRWFAYDLQKDGYELLDHEQPVRKTPAERTAKK